MGKKPADRAGQKTAPQGVPSNDSSRAYRAAAVGPRPGLSGTGSGAFARTVTPSSRRATSRAAWPIFSPP
jgi:hypothetical protein